MLERFRLHLLSVLFFAACLLLAAALAEVGFWIWAHMQAAESRDHVMAAGGLPVRLRPHYEGVFWSIPFRSNNLGFRDEPDVPLEPPPGERRVLSLGDSIGFGLGVPADAHYTKVAERRLAGSGLRILNAGGLGYCPSCYTVWLRREGLELGPEVVVLETELMNDVTDEALLRWEEATDGGPARVIGGRYVTSWDGALLGTYAPWGGWWERTYLYTHLTRRTLYLLRRLGMLSGPAHPAYYSLGFDAGLLTRDRLEEGWGRLEGAVAAAYRLCRERGVDFVLFVMPARWVFEDAGGYTEEARRARERLLTWCREQGIPHVDVAPYLEQAGGAKLYFDFAHLTVEGNRVVGEVLADYLQEASAEDREGQ
ncbi:MAG: hypothetical protein Kow00109_13100 [Acidobacteriota bacterium]